MLITKSALMVVATFALCCGFDSGCANSGFNAAPKEAKIIPDITLGSLHYVSTDMLLDGGTVLQTYQDAQGGEYVLRFPRKESSSLITWQTPTGELYSLAVRENQNVITDFLTGTLVRYKKNWFIYEDIRHALLAIVHLPQPPLWNYSSEKLDGTPDSR